MMNGFIGFLVLFFLCLVSIFPAMAEEIDINKRLDEFYIKYKKTQFKNQENAIEALVKIDIELRNFLKEISEKGNHNHINYWKDYYTELDLTIGHYSDEFEYEGALLEKAHKINPNSKYRNHTFFSEINSGKWCWVRDSKNIAAAHQYLKEFPNGPFAVDVYRELGEFYSSLYDYIRLGKDTLKSQPHDELKQYDESAYLIDYIEDISKATIETQEAQAKASAIKYLEIYLKAKKNLDYRIKERLTEIKEGTEQLYGIHSCPD